MGSNRGKGRNQGRDPRRGAKGLRFGFLDIESLEGRVLLSTGALNDVKDGPMAAAGQDLINVYQSYLSTNGDAAKIASQNVGIRFQGTSVGVDTNWNGA